MNFEEWIEALRVNVDTLHANVHELFEASQRHDAQIAELITLARQDGENIRALARVAELHHQRLTNLEGGEES